MESQQERGFWSQLTTVSKILIFLVVLGVIGGSIWYIYNQDKAETATAPPNSDTVAVSDGVGTTTSVSTDSVAVDMKEPAKTAEKVSDVAVDEAPAPAKTAEPEKKVVSVKKQKPAVKKSVAKKSETTPAPVKSKKKTKNNEDVEVDI
jgi:outer membrane biosynthesis protein TonB